MLVDNNILHYLNRVPASRNILKPIFLFFSNFDDLWLFNYHDLEYNKVVD